MKTSFLITDDQINGPLDIRQTMQSGQLAEPEWSQLGDFYWDILPLANGVVKCEILQEGSPDEPRLRVEVVGDSFEDATITEVRDELFKIFRLNDGLSRFYDEFRDDLISPAFSDFRGLRLMRASDPFESLTCCLCSQNSSVRQVNSTMRLIRQRFGELIALPDGTYVHAFPSPSTLAKVPTRRLATLRPLAYRAKYIANAARLVSKGKLDFERLRQMPYESARESLIEIPGIGPKVADCFLLYGLGNSYAAPVDRWIHRIVSRMYFGGQKVSVAKAASFLRQRYGPWAGYVQLYLYHYARLRKII